MHLLRRAHQVNVNGVSPAQIAAGGKPQVGLRQHKALADRVRIAGHGRVVLLLDLRPEDQHFGLGVKGSEEGKKTHHVARVGRKFSFGHRELEVRWRAHQQSEGNVLSQFPARIIFHPMLGVELLEFRQDGSILRLKVFPHHSPRVAGAARAHARVVPRGIQCRQHAEELLVRFQQDVPRRLRARGSGRHQHGQKRREETPHHGARRSAAAAGRSSPAGTRMFPVRPEMQRKNWSQRQTDYPRTVIRRRDRTTSPSVGLPNMVAGWKMLK